MSFQNPLGFLALGAIPVVLAIHLLRIRARRVRVSTLFLLEPRGFEGRGGRKLERLRSSPLLWLQLAAVLVSTWLLVEPRWLREDSTEHVVVVVDASASMSAFEEASFEALSRYMGRVEKSAAHVEWILLSSDPKEETLYRGVERERALEAFREVQHTLGTHDLSRVLTLSSSIAGPRGRVVLVSDSVPDVPPGVQVLAAGAPFDNVGFASVSFDGDRSWRAIVKNSGASAARRQWWTEVDGVASSPATLELGAGELAFLSGRFGDAERLELVLEGDRFVLDDRLPIVRPRPKTLSVRVGRGTEAAGLAKHPFVGKFLATLEPVELVSGAADLVLGGDGSDSEAAIVFAKAATGYRTGPIVVEHHPLVEGLDFRGLVMRNPKGARPDAPASRTLVWQGESPLMSLEGRKLLVGFALQGSNADRIPAFVLALHRFAESVRRAKVAFEQKNVETNQLLDSGRRAPGKPGFFEIEAVGEPLLVAAAHFADVREADFSRASSKEPDPRSGRDVMVRNTRPDPLTALWILALGALALGGFCFEEKGA